MPFNDVTNLTGIIQRIELWTGLGNGGISNNATFLKIMTANVNEAFDRLMPLLYSFTDQLKWDDQNQTDLPIGTIDVVSGQPDYTIAQDANSLDILNITNVRVLASNTATIYYPMTEMTIDDPNAVQAMSPDSPYQGVPRWFLKRGNTIFLFPKPNYNATGGIKIYFERKAVYFTSADTTKQPGIPRPFHGLLALYAAYDWLCQNQPDGTVMITRIEAQIQKRETALRDAIRGRYPRHNVLKPDFIGNGK